MFWILLRVLSKESHSLIGCWGKMEKQTEQPELRVVKCIVIVANRTAIYGWSVLYQKPKSGANTAIRNLTIRMPAVRPAWNNRKRTQRQILKQVPGAQTNRNPKVGEKAEGETKVTEGGD